MKVASRARPYTRRRLDALLLATERGFSNPRGLRYESDLLAAGQTMTETNQTQGECAIEDARAG